MMIHQAFAERRKKIRSTLKRAPRRISRLKGWHAQRWKDSITPLLNHELMIYDLNRFNLKTGLYSPWGLKKARIKSHYYRTVTGEGFLRNAPSVDIVGGDVMAKKDTYLALLRRGIDDTTAQLLADAGLKIGDLKKNRL